VQITTGGTRADAEYFGFDPTYDWNDGVNIGLRLSGATDLPADVDDTWWGDYRPDHTYVMQVTGNGAVLHAYYYNTSEGHEGSSGSLNVEIYSDLRPQAVTPTDV